LGGAGGPQLNTAGGMQLELWLADLERLSPILEQHERATPRLSDCEIARSQAMPVTGNMQRDWRAAHITLRILIERLAGAGSRQIPFNLGPGGRPDLDIPNFSFSLSHTAGLALIALSRQAPVGVDIERRRPIRVNLERRSALMAHAAGLAPAHALPAAPDDGFLQSWVRLEAVAKASGLGIGRTLADAGLLGKKSPAPDRSDGRSFDVRDIEAGPDLYAAIAAPILPAEVTVLRMLDFEHQIEGLINSLN
jgi:4'-phosphopantetheinyl transferase